MVKRHPAKPGSPLSVRGVDRELWARLVAWSRLHHSEVGEMLNMVLRQALDSWDLEERGNVGTTDNRTELD